MIALLTFGLFLVAMGVISIIKRRKNEKTFMDSLAELGLAPGDLIPAGDYVAGSLTLGSFREIFLVASGKDILIGARDAVTNKFKTLATITKTALTTEDVTKHSDMISGEPYYFLTISWSTSGRILSVVFSFRGSGAAERAERCRGYLSNFMD